MDIALSILIPAITERIERLQVLMLELERQSYANSLNNQIEIISVVDNRAVSIGMKRQAVLMASHGRYVASVDDDDWVEPDYLLRLVEGTRSGVDVVTFQTKAAIEDHLPVIVDMRLKQANEQVTFNDDPEAPRPVIKRAAWHTCAWRRELAVTSTFPDLNYSEDWAWAEPLNERAVTSQHIEKVLHHYVYKKTVSRAI